MLLSGFMGLAWRDFDEPENSTFGFRALAQTVDPKS